MTDYFSGAKSPRRRKVVSRGGEGGKLMFVKLTVFPTTRGEILS